MNNILIIFIHIKRAFLYYFSGLDFDQINLVLKEICTHNESDSRAFAAKFKDGLFILCSNFILFFNAWLLVLGVFSFGSARIIS
jgi:tetrahydromethanopterin S-methyltransferase subunit E